MPDFSRIAEDVFERCLKIATFTETPGVTTRRFLTPPMHACHDYLASWMRALGMQVSVDNMGNLRGLLSSGRKPAKRLLIGSHLDTVPNAGAFDGILGVVLGIDLVEALENSPPSFDIEVIGFSEEEGVRFSIPFLGSRALIGDVDDALLSRTDEEGISVAEAIRNFGCDPEGARLSSDAFAYLEFHIEQGPVLESAGQPVAVVDSIVGQSRASVTFLGKANHAGTTPMVLRRDALTAAAEWIGIVEKYAKGTPGLVATVGRLEIQPGATNVIPAEASASLDVRHASDTLRMEAVEGLLGSAQQIAARRGLSCESEVHLNQRAVQMDRGLVELARQALVSAGVAPHRMASGAGHDAMIIAKRLPSVMIFLRSPGGVSHHPDESVHIGDIEIALRAGVDLLQRLDSRLNG